MILNDELNEEIGELKKELQEYSNELNKSYSSDNTKSQKMIKTIEELEQKIDIVGKSKNAINNELAHAVHIIKKNILKKLKIFEESKKLEFQEPEEPEEDYFNFFDESGIHKYTNTKYDFNGFDKEGLHKDTKDTYDPNGFDKYGKHKDTKYKYNPNGFDKHGLHKDTKNEYDPNGFYMNGKHKDTNTFLDKKNNIRKDILKNINWLKDRDEFLKLNDEIIKNGEFSINTKNESISSGMFKKFLEDILSGNIKDNEVKNYTKSINDIEKILNNSIKSKNNDKLKNYIKKVNYLVFGKDKERIKTNQAKSFKNQKGKGHVNLPIALSKIYTNNSSKELINNIKQLINDL